MYYAVNILTTLFCWMHEAADNRTSYEEFGPICVATSFEPFVFRRSGRRDTFNRAFHQGGPVRAVLCSPPPYHAYRRPSAAVITLVWTELELVRADPTLPDTSELFRTRADSSGYERALPDMRVIYKNNHKLTAFM